MPDIPTTLAAQIAEIVLTVTCDCGCGEAHQIDCQQDIAGVWSAPLEDRYILCETCGTLLDAGLQITVGAPHA